MYCTQTWCKWTGNANVLFFTPTNIDYIWNPSSQANMTEFSLFKASDIHRLNCWSFHYRLGHRPQLDSLEQNRWWWKTLVPHSWGVLGKSCAAIVSVREALFPLSAHPEPPRHPTLSAHMAFQHPPPPLCSANRPVALRSVPIAIPGTASINYPEKAALRFKNVTSLMFPHLPPSLPLPPPGPARLPTISPLRRRKSVSRVGLHNGWDRLTVQLMIVRNAHPRSAADARRSRTHQISNDWLLTRRLWKMRKLGLRCQTEARADWRCDAANQTTALISFSFSLPKSAVNDCVVGNVPRVKSWLADSAANTSWKRTVKTRRFPGMVIIFKKVRISKLNLLAQTQQHPVLSLKLFIYLLV